MASVPDKTVVLGLGYVGLPLVVQMCHSGHRVVGVDLSERVVDGLNGGRSHVDDITDEAVAEILQLGFTATTDLDTIRDADAVVVCVPTPLSDEGLPDLAAVISAGTAIGERVKPGALVVLESTTYPGTTDDLFAPLVAAGGLVAGHDLHVAFSPERVDPGNAKYGIWNTPKVVGGLTPACTEAAADFYGTFVEQVVRAKGAREAEMAKLLENTYRHINIALVNEMAKFSHELGIDLWDVINCAKTKPFGFQAFYPGPGVGGHCIPIDPNYLSHTVRTRLHQPFRFVELAEEINQSMPGYLARRLQDLLNDAGKAVKGARVLLLGVTYKADIADERESPAVPLAQRLLEMGADLSYHDPRVANWHVASHGQQGARLDRVEPLDAAIADADVVVLLQAHQEYADLDLSTATVVFDTRGARAGDNVVRL